MTYLEAAAAELRKASEANDKHAADPDKYDRATRRREAHAERMRIADAYTRLAAIEAGLPPCLGHQSITEEEA
jgi:hypothetical protein